MFGPVGCIDIGILHRVPGMDHLPVADIDPYMGYRRARRVGAGEENQVSRLGVLSGNRGAHVEKPLGCGASHTGNTALIEDIGNKAAAIKAVWPRSAEHIRLSEMFLRLRNQRRIIAIAHRSAGICGDLRSARAARDQVGPGISFGMSKRNAFRGAEKLKFEVHGSYEWQTNSNVIGDNSVINSYEYGTSLSLDYPRLVMPGWRKLSRKAFTSTSFTLDATWLNRANFFSMVSLGARVAYTYQSKLRLKHEFVPFRLDYDELLSTTQRFDSIMNANEALYISMRNQFVPSMRYIMTYSSSKRARNPISFILDIKESGNVTSGIFAAFGKPFHQKDKKLFNVPFAQYLRISADFRQSFKLTSRSSLVGRISLGGIYSYGNSTNAPYNDLFYVGGANSIRAFNMRGVGPGSNVPGLSRYSYVDQMGDIKFEANLEYRFPIVGSLYGATFLDAGNVWLMHADPNRPGGNFDLKRLGREIALGTGLGVRYDLDFLVLRFDVGVGLHAPYDTGKSGYYNLPRFKNSLAYHLAVGYPF